MAVFCYDKSMLRNCPPFLKRGRGANGFTLIELLVVIVIIGVLAAMVLVAINPSKRFQEFYFNKSVEQLGILVRASESFALRNGDYPADTDRNVPTELKDDLRGEHWPKAPWPGSVFDWDNIHTPLPTYAPQEPYIQYSIRF